MCTIPRAFLPGAQKVDQVNSSSSYDRFDLFDIFMISDGLGVAKSHYLAYPASFICQLIPCSYIE